jgi:hypothetical protein
VNLIPLSGPISSAEAEISGMAWYSDTLILLPQYPDRFGPHGSAAVFTLNKSDILDYLSGKRSDPLQPGEMLLIAPHLESQISGFEGFEAITIDTDLVYLTIEARPGGMMGYLVSGRVAKDTGQIILDASHMTAIPPQADLGNTSDESLFVFGSRLFSLYEVNGAGLNPEPVAHMFDLSLQSLGSLPFPHVEYRITDATPPDDSGSFWAINYFYPGDKFLAPDADPITEQFGEGLTHSHSNAVERLLAFQFSEDGIVLADTPPIQLELSPDGVSRNWEAIARLDEQGFLLATDKYPQTMLGFVPYP